MKANSFYLIMEDIAMILLNNLNSFYRIWKDSVELYLPLFVHSHLFAKRLILGIKLKASPRRMLGA